MCWSMSVSLMSGYVCVIIFVFISWYRLPITNALRSLNALLKRSTFRFVMKSLRSPPMSLSPGICIDATFGVDVAKTLRKRSAYRACASSVATLPSSIKSPIKQITSGRECASARLNVFRRNRSESVIAMREYHAVSNVSPKICGSATNSTLVQLPMYERRLEQSIGRWRLRMSQFLYFIYPNRIWVMAMPSETVCK